MDGKFFVKLTLDGDNNKAIEAPCCDSAFVMRAPVTVLHNEQAKSIKCNYTS